MESTIILIELEKDCRWVALLKEVASDLGRSVEVVESNHAEDLVDSWRNCELIIIDASHVEALSHTVASIRSRSIDVPILVFSSAPGWKEAKEAILAGASDYQLKSSRYEDIMKSVDSHLMKRYATWDNTRMLHNEKHDPAG